jgi:Uma2 family endonuclease
MDLYATLGIPNYLLYDAEALYLPSPLMGFQLVDGVYIPIPPGVDGGIHSDVLALDFHIRERRLGIYDRVGGQWLQTPAENAEARAEQEAIARQKAEEEVKRLREQLARAQTHT